MNPFIVEGKMKRFGGKGGWHYVEIPRSVSKIVKPLTHRGFTPALFTLGQSSWSSSLMPKGVGAQFIAVPSFVRKAEEVFLGNTVTITFVLRER